MPRPNDIPLPLRLNPGAPCSGGSPSSSTPLDNAEAALWRQCFNAAANPEIDEAIRQMLDDLAEDLARRKPICEQSGKCCRFETYGHRLYVTALEAAWTVLRLDEAARSRLAAAPLPRVDACPFQVDRLCTVHALRPMGCRVFFCDPNAQAWQNQVYESYQTRIRQLHERHGTPYRYMDWRVALDEARRSTPHEPTNGKE